MLPSAQVIEVSQTKRFAQACGAAQYVQQRRRERRAELRRFLGGESSLIQPAVLLVQQNRSLQVTY